RPLDLPGRRAPDDGLASRLRALAAVDRPCELRAVGAEGDVVQAARALQRGDELAGRDVPHVDARRMRPRGGQQCAIGAEGDVADLMGERLALLAGALDLALERVQALAGG